MLANLVDSGHCIDQEYKVIHQVPPNGPTLMLLGSPKIAEILEIIIQILHEKTLLLIISVHVSSGKIKPVLFFRLIQRRGILSYERQLV